MASWLKVAEDLFEVVDRRAKLVVSELGDEQTSSHSSASSSGQEIQQRKKKQNSKDQFRRLTSEPQKLINAPGDPIDTQSAFSSEAQLVIQSESLGIIGERTAVETNTEAPVSGLADIGAEVHVRNCDDVSGIIASDSEVGVTPSVVYLKETSAENPRHVTGTSTASVDGTDLNDALVDLVVNSEASSKVGQDNLDTEQVDRESNSQLIDRDNSAAPETSSASENLHDAKNESSSGKLLEQLDEAQGLLQSIVSTGQSKEARLARVCAGLSSRLQEYKSENAQLEELLIRERERSSSYESSIKQLQQDLSLARVEVTKVESSLSEALAAKNAEIETLLGSVDSLKNQASSAEGKIATLQESMDAVMRGRELTETRMMQSLREELAAAERRADEERLAHNATKMAAVEREVELEHRAVEASNALARMQRSADESISRAMDFEHKVALLEVECASLNQELQDMEAKLRRGQKKLSEDANQVLQIQVWQEEVERARQAQRDAEKKLSSLEAEMQKMRVEMAGMRMDAEHYSRQEHMELEKRYRELTDLLYQKQTQLELMASEKAATQYQLEKEASRLREAQIEVERTRVSRRSLSSWEEDTDIKPFDSLPLHHQHMVGASIQLQRAAKLLDSGAVRATRYLWRTPVARVILLLYLVFVHLFLMYLLHHLQEQAARLAGGEFSAAMELNNSTFP